LDPWSFFFLGYSDLLLGQMIPEQSFTEGKFGDLSCWKMPLLDLALLLSVIIAWYVDPQFM
jgi:hypothetical protein